MPNVQRSKELRPFQTIGRTKKKVGVYGGMGAGRRGKMGIKYIQLFDTSK